MAYHSSEMRKPVVGLGLVGIRTRALECWCITHSVYRFADRLLVLAPQVDAGIDSVVLYQHYVVLSFTSSTMACSRCACCTAGADDHVICLCARR